MTRNPIAKNLNVNRASRIEGQRVEPLVAATEQIWCSRCGSWASVGTVPDLIWVHGHSQCAACHRVIDECCQGEGWKDDL